MRIGIDLGGTKIEGIALADDGTVPVRHRVATPHAYAATLDALVALVRTIEQDAGFDAACGAPAGAPPTAVGMGIPGTVVPATGRVKNANSTWLNGQPLATDLAARLGRPVRVSNDANCFALSEATDGAGLGAGVVFGVILGTGVGGGVVVHGRGLEGANQIAGEWGHTPLPWATADEGAGPPCYCGRTGCIESYLSGPGLERDHARHAGAGSEGGPARTSHEIVRAAAAGDPASGATMARYVDRLARGLAVVAHLVDPDVVVLGGGLSNVPGLAEAAQARLGRYLFAAGVEQPDGAVATRIVRNRHGDSSGVRGAAWLWPATGSAVTAARDVAP
jgi:fructokinase